MPNPTTGWDRVPIYGKYGIPVTPDAATTVPVVGSVRVTMMSRVYHASGRTIYPWGATLDFPLSISGEVAFGLPALDDPDVLGATPYKVEERFVNAQGATSFIEPTLAMLGLTPAGLDLTTVIVPDDGPTLAPPAALLKGVPGGVAALNSLGQVTDASGSVVQSVDVSGLASTAAVSTALVAERTASDGAYALAGAVFDVRKYGSFLPGNTAAVNAAAIQAANGAAKAAGGGRVLLPPGTYPCVGVIQDSRVELHGPGCTLKHPDGLGGHVIASRALASLGNMTAGAYTCTVASVTGFEVGAVIGVRGAGGISPVQNSALTAGISSSDTSLTLTDSTGFPTLGAIQCGTELISYATKTGNVLSGLTRGVYGSTAAAHATGDVAGISMRLVGEILAVNPTTKTITMDKPAVQSITQAAIAVGPVGCAITGLTIDGTKQDVAGHANAYAVKWEMVRYGRLDYTAIKAEAALYLAAGTRDCVANVIARDCSLPGGSRGAVCWLFQGARDNVLNANITGEVWAGVIIDNRTISATEWDIPADGNSGRIVINAAPHTPWITNSGMFIMVSSRNRFDLTCSNVRTPLTVGNAEQTYSASPTLPDCIGNVVNLAAENCYVPWSITAPGNTITGWWRGETAGVDTANSFITAALASGGAPSIPASAIGSGVLDPARMPGFADGTTTAPGLAFASETNTGLFKIAAGDTAYTAQGTTVVRLQSAGLKFSEGKNIDVGTATGTKIGVGATAKLGFYGAAPVVRPAALADTSGATLAALETEVNGLKARLRTLGLMA